MAIGGMSNSRPSHPIPSEHRERHTELFVQAKNGSEDGTVVDLEQCLSFPVLSEMRFPKPGIFSAA
jgi:hypothetical protein